MLEFRRVRFSGRPKAVCASRGSDRASASILSTAKNAAPDGLTSVFDMTWVVGGSGRFAGATGAGTTHGSSLLSTGTTSASYEGEIAS
ncbi:MAG: hypothetical protein A2V85_09795 [Chloroflexi bacterium RBG_16_72_14]|nr:MAG: hypothetical protein A2V85_09795 [Chloroflexi bacterium RBG_16_72_14]